MKLKLSGESVYILMFQNRRLTNECLNSVRVRLFSSIIGWKYFHQAVIFI